MKAPIYLNENGDVTKFDSIEEAEAYMEPIDVEHGEYVVSDAEGKQLVAVVVTEEGRLFGDLLKTHMKRVRIKEPDAQ